MLVFLVPSFGYGWGYRRWGLPYPSYIQRRRAAAAAAGSAEPVNHKAWGRMGDVVWLVLLIGLITASFGFFVTSSFSLWRR